MTRYLRLGRWGWGTYGSGVCGAGGGISNSGGYIGANGIQRDHNWEGWGPHALPWGRALGIAQTPLQWNGRERFED
eukprot:scaffold5152_cov113-Isochrysis_galbana.AAC.2